MRLEAIKLAGFKSFIEPTVIPVVGNLTAIVGPNGCGKSNIIDAIRWVMGESSAKHLRGGHMADVIFNGSATRKPVGTASVELIFNNSEGKLGGEYAQYEQISIRRQVSRDGQSSYFLNGARCRRKDITDIFLGTGLGARSYAIIEQGMISRMVEAKPDELRAHIEEAAGISKYKERRGETEARMKHTRENLERLADVRDEVGKQVRHLQKQAEKAEQYTLLKKQERQCKRELLAIRWHGFQDAAASLTTAHDRAAAEHDRLLEENRELESAIENKRAEIRRQQDDTGRRQAEYYAALAEAGKLEQAVGHGESNRRQTEAEIDRLTRQGEQTERELTADADRLRILSEKLKTAESEFEQARDRLDETVLIQQEYQQQAQVCEEQWEKYRGQTARYAEQAEVEKAKIGQLEDRKRQLQARLDRLHGEHGELSAAIDRSRLDYLRADIDGLEAERHGQQEAIARLQDDIYGCRRQLKELNEQLHSARSEWHRIKGAEASLELLQQHATGRDNRLLTDWLESIAVAEPPRLAECLDVESGWERAVETVLDGYLQALCLDSADSLVSAIGGLPETSLTVFETGGSGVSEPGVSEPDACSLDGKVKAPWPLNPLLSGVYCAGDSAEARALSRRLRAHESVIARDGTWFGPGWLKIRRAGDAKAGVLQREKQLRELRESRDLLEAETAELENLLAEAEVELKAAEIRREDRQRRYNALGAELSAKSAEAGSMATRLEQQDRRLAQIDSERQELAEEQAGIGEALAEARLIHEEASAMLARQAQKKARLEALTQDLQNKRRVSEQTLNENRQRVFDLKAELESARAEQAFTARQIERLQSQRQETGKRIDHLREALAQAVSPLADCRDRLRQIKTVKDELESGLKDRRRLQEELEAALTALLERQLRLRNTLAERRQALDKTALERQECEIRRQAVAEQLAEMDIAVDDLALLLPPDGNEAVWKKKADELGVRLEKLGTVNLTALEEYQAQSERLKFLDEQHADLTAALAALEQAIGKIDKESRLRFQETFDKINAGLAEKFPKLFGGGQAYLAVGEADDGVTVVARPPGKKNSSIHLLSGGEKALTAVALVFSIFDLNPAPFCLLDEVDAPLDDANVGRFSKMVQDMARTVQFIYISHNKATMEIASQLTGVTMKEPGVSRMVAVDIEEAVNMADV